MRLASLSVAAAAALATCGAPDRVAEEERDAALLPDPANGASASATGGRPENASVTTSARAVAGTVPAALHGRWGMSPGDCDSALGAARGLLVVNVDELRFYESRAVPADGVQTSPNSISGDFSFTGEGQQWTRHQTLELREGRLVRTERDPVAGFRYVRCD